MSENAQNVRRSKRLADKKSNGAKTCPSNPGPKEFSLRHLEQEKQQTKPQFADSRNILDTTATISRGSDKIKTKVSGTTTRKSSSTTKKENQARIETEIKKKHLEQEAIKNQQELLDLELAMKLAEIEDEGSRRGSSETGSVATEKPDVETWMNGENPWENANIQKNGTSEVLNTSNKVCVDNFRVGEIYSTSKNDKIDYNKPNFSKMLTRQSIPKELPIFDGDPSEWHNFIYNFRSSTALCDYSDEENICRLQKCLKGNARKIVNSLLIFPKNLNKIIGILENRFGRPELIIQIQLEKVRNLPVIKEDKLDSIIEFSDEVNNVVATLDTLQEEDHLRNPVLLQELVSKLPQLYQLKWIEYISAKKPEKKEHKLVLFSQWLNDKSNSICQLQNSYFDKKVKNRQLNPRNVTLTTRNSQKTCICCEKQVHHLSTCSKFRSLSTDERWSFVTTNKICFSCLVPFHISKMCQKKQKCTIQGCKRPHHELLHSTYTKNKSDYTENVQRVEKNCHVMSNKEVLLKILPVVLINGKNKIETYALLDDASTVTLIDQDLADRLNLIGPQKSLCLQWTNNQTNEQNDSRIVSVTISSNNTNKNYNLRHIRTIKGLELPSQTVRMEDLLKKYPYLNHKIDSMNMAQPKILIGQDNWPLLVSRQVINGPWNGPASSKTALGWVIHGNSDRNGNENLQKQFLCHVNLKEKDDLDLLHDLVKEQWRMESYANSEHKKSMSKEDMRAQDILDNTMKRIGDKMETGLLWKDKNIILPESKQNALRRLKCTEHKMDKDANYGQKYCEKIYDMEEKQYLSKISKEKAMVQNNKCWFLPHFGVINPNKPGKIRIVLDAAAKSHGVSLNDCLLSGPDLYNSLQTILINFRIKTFAFTADIKEMFLQVAVRKEDRVAQRILFRGMDREREPDIYELNVVFFGSTCGPCLAQEAKNRNALEYSHKYPEAAKAIIYQHYMDDYLGGADSEEEGKKLIEDIIHVHKKGGFTICNWIANSKNILKEIDTSVIADSQKNMENKLNNSTERILGVWWDPHEDIFTFKSKLEKVDQDILDQKRKPTKREVLKILMSVFDPLGFLANFLILGKILLQDIWRNRLIGWDDEITSNLNEKWEKWILDLKKISQFKIYRQYSKIYQKATSIQLHIFCDASESAMACSSYLRFCDDQEIEVCFVIAKTKVAPLSPISVPRLELQAALMGARLAQNLKNDLDLNVQTITYWTDSATVLHWIYSEARRFKVFVAQRIGEIQEITNISDWRYVPSKENVADEATKIHSNIDFTVNTRWIHGPSFLYKNPEEWPTNKITSKINSEDIEEKPEKIFLHKMIVTKMIIPDPSRFSKWLRLLRSTAWLFRYLYNCREKQKRRGELTIEEINKAKNFIFKKIQTDSFSEEMNILQNKESLPTTSKLYSLDCIVGQEGLIRLGGRLNNAVNLDENCKNPIVLDPKHHVTKLIIKHYHEEINHHGQESVVNKLRQNFWILRMRQAVRSCWANCQKCCNRRATEKIPLMGQLPRCRVEPTIRPFINTGVDYFGPIEVTVKRSHEKRYGVIFTCMVTRAVHLEIANDLSTNGFIHVLRQFGCRRGFPEEMFSDNGKNFIGAERELSENLEKLNQSDIQIFCTLKNIKWNFNPPLAPHMGGSWERLIRSIKKHLQEVLKNKFPQEYVLRTVFAEIENILNSRPLTHVSVDPNDPEPLTPNSFLIGRNYAAQSCTTTEENNINLLSKWKAAQKITEIFWKRWSNEYLPSIIRRQKWHKKESNPETGNVVLISDPNMPRNTWPIARIVAVYPSKDGIVRSVDIRTSRGIILRRPISRICVLNVEKTNEI